MTRVMTGYSVWGGLILAVVLCGCYADAEPEEPVVPSGAYLGQRPPGLKPEIFAPGIVSTGFGEYNAVFTNHGDDFYYVLAGAPHRVIVSIAKEDDQWSTPRVAPFSDPRVLEFCTSPEGDRIIMLLKQSVQVGGRRSDEIRNWIVERNSDGWREPVKLDDTLAGPCSLSSKGDLYFSSPHLGGIGGDDIFVSELVDGQYTEPVNVGPSINTSLHEADPFIAPDQSYIVFVSADTDSDVFDLFVSFRLDDDSWSRAVTLGDQVNSTAKELLPTVTPDGKYLFFTSERRTYIPDPNNLSYDEKIHILNNPGNGWGDIYWVDAAVIEGLRKRAGKLGDS